MQRDFEMAQVEMFFVETSLAGAALLYNPLSSHLLGLQVVFFLVYRSFFFSLQVVSPFVIFNIFIGIYTVYTGHIIVIFGTLMI